MSFSGAYDEIVAVLERRHGPVVFDGAGLTHEHRDKRTEPNLYPIARQQWVQFRQTFAGVMGYPCDAISDGLRAAETASRINEEARRRGEAPPIPSTYKLEEYPQIGGKYHYEHHILPNVRDNLIRTRILERRFPDIRFLPPTVREAALRSLSSDPAATGRRTFDEVEYMGVWYPADDACKFVFPARDWSYTRNTVREVERALINQRGLNPYGHADVTISDIDGNSLGVAYLAGKIAESARYLIGKGLEPGGVATALAHIFTMQEWLATGTGPQAVKPIHPNWVATVENPVERKALLDLKREFEPLLLGPLAGFIRPHDLPEPYQSAISKARLAPVAIDDDLRMHYKPFADDISARAEEITSLDLPTEFRRKLYASARLHPPRARRIYDQHTGIVDTAASLMFDDGVYGKLEQWEQIALKIGMPAMEIAGFTAREPLATIVLSDFKQGHLGAKAAAARGIADPAELQAALGREIIPLIAANRSEEERTIESLRKDRPGRVVIGESHFQEIFTAIARERSLAAAHKHGPEFYIAAPGGSKTSPGLRLLARGLYMIRNCDEAVFQEGWENSNTLTQLRVEARLIQAGLVQRPLDDQAGLKIFDAGDTATPRTLLDDMHTLTAVVARRVKDGVRAPEQALAMRRLAILHEMLIDPTLAGTLIDPLKADEDLTTFNRKEMRELIRDKAQPLWWNQGLLWVGRERLEPPPCEGETARQKEGRKLQALRHREDLQRLEELAEAQARAKALPPTHETIINRGGPSL